MACSIKIEDVFVNVLADFKWQIEKDKPLCRAYISSSASASAGAGGNGTCFEVH